MYSNDQVLQEAEAKMKSAIEAMIKDYSTYRTGRVNPDILNRVMVNAYGSDVPIKSVASISVPEPRQLLINPFDKNMLAAIEKAIVEGNLGISPSNDGKHIRLNFPQMTEERRKELVKEVNGRTEQCCVTIRNARRDAIDLARKAQKNKEISEDNAKDDEDSIQKLTDKYVSEAHSHQKKKETELMEI